VIGKLNFLEKSTRPDIAYAIHQCARFCEDPKQVHFDAVIHLTKYLAGTTDQGIILDPKHDKSFEVYADADFAENWNKITVHKDPSTAKSRSGYVIRGPIQTGFTFALTNSKCSDKIFPWKCDFPKFIAKNQM
jgi:hypothetical protein